MDKKDIHVVTFKMPDGSQVNFQCNSAEQKTKLLRDGRMLYPDFTSIEFTGFNRKERRITGTTSRSRPLVQMRGYSVIGGTAINRVLNNVDHGPFKQWVANNAIRKEEKKQAYLAKKGEQK